MKLIVRYIQGAGDAQVEDTAVYEGAGYTWLDNRAGDITIYKDAKPVARYGTGCWRRLYIDEAES